MPIIQFNLMKGRSNELKRELAKRVSETVSEVLGVSPQTIRILIHEMGKDDFSVGGITLAEKLENVESAEINEVNDGKN